MAQGVGNIDITDLEAKVSEVKNKDINVEKKYEEQFRYNEKTVGLRNMNTVSSIRIPENGNIEMCAGDKAGVLCNYKHKTVTVYGEVVNAVSPVIRFTTKPSGLIWNGYQVNPRLYQLTDLTNTAKNASVVDDLSLKCSVRYWKKDTREWDRKEIEIKPFIKVAMDAEYQKLLAELNIPI